MTGGLVRSYSYDAAGHTTGYGTNGFTYNNRGRVAATSASSTDYLYNALGQMYEKSGTAGTTIFMHDEAGHLIGEYSSTGALIEETVWLGDIPVATVRPTPCGLGIFYIHTDHLNRPHLITRRTTSDIVWRWDTDPFGDTAPNQNPGGLGTFVYNPRFPGQYYQAETGLNQNWNRDYDPLVGRYIESDPIGLKGGSWSTYAYVRNNPITYSDPQGLALTCPECTQTFLDCLANCIRAYDPFNNYGKLGLYGLGGPIPKALFGLPEIGSPYMSLPSWLGLGQGTAASGANILRIVGRGGSAAFIIYGTYLFGVEILCAKHCADNQCAY
jgi:RHS repeat-associated protein